MRILEFTVRKLKALVVFRHPQSAFCVPPSLKHFSCGQQSILFLLILLIFAVLYLRFYENPPFPDKVIQETVVEISGEVRDPGVHVFENPPSLAEAIKKAGGLKGSSLPRSLSSEVLDAGTRLTVSKEFSPGTEDPPSRQGRAKQEVLKIRLGTMEPQKLLVFSISLDLNRVSANDLCLVPGIGESLAHEIVAYRERRRGFRSVEELKNVRGIGEKKYQSIRGFFVTK